MAIEGFKPYLVDEFRGRSKPDPDILETDPKFASDEANCDFETGHVASRSGFTTLSTITGQSAILSLDEFIALNGTHRVLAHTSAGNLYSGVDNGGSAFALVDRVTLNAADIDGPRMHSTTLFNKQWMGFGLRATGTSSGDQPRSYDGTNLDRVSQQGPGISVSLADGGVGGTLNGGTYACRVFFKTRSGYWTRLSPRATVTGLAANHKINVTNIPLGPANVVGRVLCFTASGATGLFPDGDNYYFIAGTAMEINDNTTTTVNGITFTDTEILAATPASTIENPTEDLQRLIELPPQAGVVAYKSRLAWFGGDNILYDNASYGILNSSFDGGFTTGTPNGWSQVAAGQSQSGDNLAITGDGVNQKGRLQNFGLLYGFLRPNRAVYARVTAKLDPVDTPSAGTFHVFITDNAGAVVSQADFTVTTWSTTQFVRQTVQLISAANNKPAFGWHLNITSGGVGFGGTALTNTKKIIIDRVDLVDQDMLTPSLVYWSRTNQAEAYDGLSGLMNVAENNGQSIRAAFVLRNACYFVKERSMYVTHDTASSEPSSWPVELVSSTVGTLSVRGVGLGDGWAIIANPQGIYYFDGGVPICISDDIRYDVGRFQELQSTRMWVRVNTARKRIYIGVPFASPEAGFGHNQILLCRYEGNTPLDGPRQWSIWSGPNEAAFGTGLDAECGLIINNPSDLVQRLLVGRGAGIGPRVDFLDSTAVNDPGPTAINSYYQTGFIGSNSLRNLIGYLTLSVRGSGSMALSAVSQDGTVQTLPAVTLQDPFNYDIERMTRIVGGRKAFRFGTNATGARWQMNKLVAYIKDKPGAPIRGYRE